MRNAAVRDAPIKLGKVECATGIGQRSNYAASKEVQIKSRKEDFVAGTGRA